MCLCVCARTLAEGEAVYQGHPVKPVVVGRVSDREAAGAVPQQGATQPHGDSTWGESANTNLVVLTTSNSTNSTDTNLVVLTVLTVLILI